jgi:ABC-type uncharacterized transport system substrate-binding protein
MSAFTVSIGGKADIMGEDPISLGLVPNLNRPGGNLTGVATLSSAVMAKRLELLNEIAPPHAAGVRGTDQPEESLRSH